MIFYCPYNRVRWLPTYIGFLHYCLNPLSELWKPHVQLLPYAFNSFVLTVPRPVIRTGTPCSHISLLLVPWCQVIFPSPNGELPSWKLSGNSSLLRQTHLPLLQMHVFELVSVMVLSLHLVRNPSLLDCSFFEASSHILFISLSPTPTLLITCCV